MYKKADQQLPWATQFSNSFNGVVNNVQNWWNTATDPNKPAGSGWDAFGKIYTSNPYMASAMTLAGATGIASLLDSGANNNNNNNNNNNGNGGGGGVLPWAIGLGLLGAGIYGYNKYQEFLPNAEAAKKVQELANTGMLDFSNPEHIKLLKQTQVAQQSWIPRVGSFLGHADATKLIDPTNVSMVNMGIANAKQFATMQQQVKGLGLKRDMSGGDWINTAINLVQNGGIIPIVENYNNMTPEARQFINNKYIVPAAEGALNVAKGKISAYWNSPSMTERGLRSGMGKLRLMNNSISDMRRKARSAKELDNVVNSGGFKFTDQKHRNMLSDARELANNPAIVLAPLTGNGEAAGAIKLMKNRGNLNAVWDDKNRLAQMQTIGAELGGANRSPEMVNRLYKTYNTLSPESQKVVRDNILKRYGYDIDNPTHKVVMVTAAAGRSLWNGIKNTGKSFLDSDPNGI